MIHLPAPLQLIPALTPPGVLTTLVAAIVVLLVVRFLLSVALKIALLAAVLAGVVWFLGAVPALPMALPA